MATGDAIDSSGIWTRHNNLFRWFAAVPLLILPDALGNEAFLPLAQVAACRWTATVALATLTNNFALLALAAFFLELEEHLGPGVPRASPWAWAT